MAQILMPKATAVWLVENTTLSFEQIAAFCGLHPLEVQGIADGEVALPPKLATEILRALEQSAITLECEGHEGHSH